MNICSFSIDDVNCFIHSKTNQVWRWTCVFSDSCKMKVNYGGVETCALECSSMLKSVSELSNCVSG